MSTKTTTNPGCVDPASQSYPAPPAQTTRPTSRGTTTLSTGEVQRRCPADVLSAASTAGGSGAVTQSTGEQQYRDLRPAETSVATCRGLPVNVTAGSSRPGGLPADVVVK